MKAAMIEGIEVEYIDRSPTQEQTPTLRLGAKGDDVLRMQTLLIAHGADIVADGIFGRATKVAVETFQTSHGLKVDGICGPVTWTALRVEPPRAGILLDDLKDMVEDLETDTSGVDVPAIDIPPVEPIEPPETKPTSVCVAISSEIRAVTQILYSEFMDKLNEETDKILKKYERI